MLRIGLCVSHTCLGLNLWEALFHLKCYLQRPPRINLFIGEERLGQRL
jgi:hypothetical protein